MKNNLLITIWAILFLPRLHGQEAELNMIPIYVEEFTITEEQAQELFEHIDPINTTLQTAIIEGALENSYITQAVALYNSLPRETPPIVGLTREIPESLVPYFEQENVIVRSYEQALPLADLKNYLNMLLIVSLLDYKQLTDFMVQVSTKSVPVTVDCALHSYITEYEAEKRFLNAVEEFDHEAVMPEEEFTMWKQWSNLHNPVFRDLGMGISRSQITNIAQNINYLEPYLAETDKILIRGLIDSYYSIAIIGYYSNIGNQAVKDKLSEFSNIAAARGDIITQTVVNEAIERLEAFEAKRDR